MHTPPTTTDPQTERVRALAAVLCRPAFLAIYLAAVRERRARTVAQPIPAPSKPIEI